MATVTPLVGLWLGRLSKENSYSSVVLPSSIIILKIVWLTKNNSIENKL